jgi:hypothetical protein
MTEEMGQTGRLGQMGRLGSWASAGFQAKFKDLNRWASDLIFKLISRILSLKSKVSNISNWILNWGQTRISKSKLFEDFSNLELLKIDLNTQIFKSSL